MTERSCYECKKEIKSGSKRFQVTQTNSYGDKEKFFFVCSECYNKRKSKSDKSYKISAIVIFLIGLITLTISPELAAEVESDVLVFQLGSLFLMIVGFLMFLFRDPTN